MGLDCFDDVEHPAVLSPFPHTVRPACWDLWNSGHTNAVLEIEDSLLGKTTGPSEVTFKNLEHRLQGMAGDGRDLLWLSDMRCLR